MLRKLPAADATAEPFYAAGQSRIRRRVSGDSVAPQNPLRHVPCACGGLKFGEVCPADALLRFRHQSGVVIPNVPGHLGFVVVVGPAQDWCRSDYSRLLSIHCIDAQTTQEVR